MSLTALPQHLIGYLTLLDLPRTWGAVVLTGSAPVLRGRQAALGQASDLSKVSLSMNRLNLNLDFLSPSHFSLKNKGPEPKQEADRAV